MEKSLTFSKFETGMDLRYIENDRDPNGFQDLHNCYVDTMNRLVKRPGLAEELQMTDDTVGLFGFNGRLWTVYKGTGTPTTQPQPADGTELWVLDLEHAYTEITKVHFVGVILGGLYIVVEYSDTIIPPAPTTLSDPVVSAAAATGPGINIIDHFYVVTDAEEWSNRSFDTDPAGIRVVAGDAVDTVNKIFYAGRFYEAKDLGPAPAASNQPIWGPDEGDVAPVAPDGSIEWTTADLLIRQNNTVESVPYSEYGSYCVPESYAPGVKWRVWYAINITPETGALTGGGTTPEWDYDEGSITVDGEILWQCLVAPHWANYRTWEIDWPEDPDGDNTQYAHTFDAAGGTDHVYFGRRNSVATGPNEPNPWNPTIGGSTVDGDITWETKTTLVTDPNCPRSAEVVLHQSKVYALGSNIKIRNSNVPQLEIDSVEEADITRFCATSDPFDWSKEEDAGFLATGVQASGSEVARALGKWNNQLVVLMEDNIQIWAVDPDPQRNALTQIIGDIGTTVSESVVNIGTDLLFLSANGFRSLGQQKDELILHDTDVGSPVDSAVVASVAALPDPSSIVATPFSTLSQMWCAVGNEIWSWSWSRNSKVNAWARFTHTTEVTYFAPLANRLYMRCICDRILIADSDNKVDWDGEYIMEVKWAFQSLKALGIMKQVQGVDVVLRGSAELSFQYDAAQPDVETTAVTMRGNTRSGQLMPVEIMATEIAPILRYKGPDDLQVDALTLYYNPIGIV